MALETNAKPYGLSDIKLTSMNGVTQVDLPASVKLSFKEVVNSAKGPGDDRIAVVVAVMDSIEWEMEATGLPLEALALMFGTTTTTSGTTPNQTKTLKRRGGLRLPYFKIYGKSLGEGDDDVHCIIYKAKLTEGMEAPLEYQKLQDVKIKGLGIDDDVNGVYDWVQNETAADLPGATGSAPALTCTPVPADAATGVSVSADLTLTFSNALVATAENGIMLTTAAGVPVAGARTINAGRTVVTLNPTSSLSASTDYLLIVPGVKDVYQQALVDTVVSFTTA
jgi:hypothetical protein